jgi:hypothetical protein
MVETVVVISKQDLLNRFEAEVSNKSWDALGQRVMTHLNRVWINFKISGVLVEERGGSVKFTFTAPTSLDQKKIIVTLQ